MVSPASNGMNQLAFSGSEDLGGGLKANFLLQQRFNPSTGGNDGTTGGRRAFQGASTVGLSGGFGNLRLGREVEAYNDANNWADPWGTVRAASIAIPTGFQQSAAVGDSGDIARTNGIHYNSPSFGGLTVGLTYGFEDQTAVEHNGAPGTKSHVSANLIYSGGPLTVFGALMQNRHDDKAYALGAGYNFGFAHLKFALHNVDGGSAANAADNYKAYQIAADFPLGATVVSVGYLNSDTRALPGGPKVKSSKLGLGANYALSKRTAFIATYGKTKANKANFDLSLRHTF